MRLIPALKQIAPLFEFRALITNPTRYLYPPKEQHSRRVSKSGAPVKQSACSVPPYCVLHDRTLTAVALARPSNPRQLLEIDGIGPTKAEKFGPAIIEICGAKLITEH